MPAWFAQVHSGYGRVCGDRVMELEDQSVRSTGKRAFWECRQCLDHREIFSGNHRTSCRGYNRFCPTRTYTPPFWMPRQESRDRVLMTWHEQMMRTCPWLVDNARDRLRLPKVLRVVALDEAWGAQRSCYSEVAPALPLGSGGWKYPQDWYI